jgi:ankyrin repeat protein
LTAGNRLSLRGVAVAVLLAAPVLSGSGSLMDAVKAGNRETIRALLKTPTDVNAAEPDGTTPLHWAVRSDDQETVRLLLGAGANAKAVNRYGVTPLLLAALNGSAPVVEILLAAGADPNGSLSEGQTVLMTAARTGNADVVRALLDRGARVDAQESSLGESALMWAAAEDHADVVTLLLERGADPETRSKKLAFPRDRFGLEGVLTILPRGNWTALMYAAREGAVGAARALIEGGANLNAVDPDGTTPLVRAVVNAHYDLAGFLIDKGADPNLADTSGMAALYAAVDLNSLGEIYGRPARKVTDRLSALGIITRLLAHGANPNAQLTAPALQKAHTPGEFTLGPGTIALMRAAKNGDAAAIGVLLAHGADPTIVQRNHTTALMFAAGLGRGLGVFAKDVGSEADLRKSAQLLLEAGVDANGVNDAGSTALHYAAEAGLNTVVTLLAEHGAQLEARDKQGRTPVDLALGVGRQGRAGGPPIVYEKTATLIRELVARRQ